MERGHFVLVFFPLIPRYVGYHPMSGYHPLYKKIGVGAFCLVELVASGFTHPT